MLPLTLGGRSLLTPGPLRVYTCGITPYDVTHLGHASTFVWADLVASLAHATGVDALTCRNVTDVDDVLTAAARGEGRHYDDFALTQEFLFDRDMRALSAAPPDMTPHARAFIRPVQRLATALLDAGAAYVSEGYVYFRGAGHRRGGRPGGERSAGRVRGVRRPARRPGPGVAVRRGGLASFAGGPPGLAQPLGLGAAGLARGVRGHGDGLPGQLRGRPASVEPTSRSPTTPTSRRWWRRRPA